MLDPRKELEFSVLPWWNTHAVDPGGGVFTCFDNRGHLLGTDKFTWSQGRWAWLCAELTDDAQAGLVDQDPEVWADRARQTARFIATNTVLPDFRTVFRTTDVGQHVPDEHGRLHTSVFADLFAALGLGAAARITPGPQGEAWFRMARAIVVRADQDVTERVAPTEPYPVPPTHLDLAEPMNLLHTSAELLRARADPQLAEIRDRALKVLITQRLSGDRWWEFKPLDSGDEALLISRHRTPGHLLEALWMISHAVAQAHDQGETITDLDPDQYRTLAERAMHIGWDVHHGGIHRYVDEHGGRPQGLPRAADDPYEMLVRRTWDTKLWWVHAEAMYTLRRLSSWWPQDPQLRSWSQRVDEWTMRVFPDRAHGEWIQIRDVTGKPLDQVVALPVKDPFHIIRSLSFVNRLDHGEAPHGRSNR